ncbi:hypothetical protein VNO77_44316 [Canavalia gladiata]|uniref:Transmembrane protein n=1 Tax=Canavalia gladiata TaxID=3824 RepID=A0AAN9PQ89_CANGL
MDSSSNPKPNAHQFLSFASFSLELMMMMMITSTVPVMVLLLFTVLSFCGRVRLQHPFTESFHNVRLDFWLSP